MGVKRRFRVSFELLGNFFSFLVLRAETPVSPSKPIAGRSPRKVGGKLGGKNCGKLMGCSMCRYRFRIEIVI